MCAKITFVLNRDYPGQICSIAKALEVVGERWSLLIVRDVMNGNRRFDELQRGLGIARNVLAARLQRLVDEDILERRPTRRARSATSTSSPRRGSTSGPPWSPCSPGATATPPSRTARRC